MDTVELFMREENLIALNKVIDIVKNHDTVRISKTEYKEYQMLKKEADDKNKRYWERHREMIKDAEKWESS